MWLGEGRMNTMRWVGGFGVVCLLLACSDDATEVNPVQQKDTIVAAPTVEDTLQIVPAGSGITLPVEYVSVAGKSNNNVDVIRHGGRVYLAIRTSEFHFASKETKMFVFSSVDEKTWSFETVFARGRDLREPRLMSWKGQLFLYFAELGSDRYSFDPNGMWVSTFEGPGMWTEPVPFYKPYQSYIPWRVKVLNNKPYMMVYSDGEHEYDFTGLPMNVEMLTTEDGLEWHAVNPDRPAVLRGGGSETDIAFDDRGELYAVVRNEPGDETGWGSKICHAPKEDITAWTCVHDPKKYDSPYLFNFEGKIFLIGRKNLTETGNFELEPDQPWSAGEAFRNLTRYSSQPKRCALWQVERSSLTVHHLVDVPGKGDTCFPSVIPDTQDPRRFILYNYSSQLGTDTDPTWAEGQLDDTFVYRTTFRFQ
jgi:hypothetical protein